MNMTYFKQCTTKESAVEWARMKNKASRKSLYVVVDFCGVGFAVIDHKSAYDNGFNYSFNF